MANSFKLKLERLIVNCPDSARARAKADVNLLLERGARSFTALLTVAKNPGLDSDSRSAACWILGQLRDPRALPTLLRLVKAKESVISWEAAKALIILKSKVGTHDLTRILRRGKATHNRAAAAYVLGLLGSKEAIQALIDALESADSPEVRSHVAEALGNIGHYIATNPLISSLSDKSSRVRFSAAFALGEIGNQRAIPALRRLSSTDRAKVSGGGTVGEEAAKAIKQMQSRRPRANK